ncbi:MAG: hypothetical protein IBJ12_09635 [Sphingomonadaceae bacterium]|nr:hypothetical protein [Sphingomonadaceae bacterium]
MSEPKPLASLSGVLLARKGLARPAMRRPSMLSTNGNAALAHDDLGWNDMGYDVDPDPSAPMDYDHNFHGTNPLAAAVPDVKHQQDRIAEEYEGEEEAEAGFDSFTQDIAPVGAAMTVVSMTPEPVVTPIDRSRATDAPRSKARSKPGMKDKAAFTLRLDSQRHLKLRLACAVRHQSAQQLVTDALDAFLESMPEIGALAASVPAKKH